MDNKPNRDRIFEQIVSVEGWQSKFDAATKCASIHADVSFLEAKLGEEAESKLRFEVFLKRAEVLIYVPPTDPVKVVQSSVAREKPLSGSRQSRTSGVSDHELRGAFSIAAAGGTPLSASAGASAAKKGAQATDLSLQGEGREFSSRQYTSEGLYCWEVTPSVANRLVGKVWDAVNEPRLSIKHLGDVDGPLDLACRVLVRCRREDIEITNISIKEKTRESLIERFKANREAAAAAYIRAALSSRDLQVLDFDEKYANVLIADVLIDEEVS